MYSIYNTPPHFGGQLVRRGRDAIASLRPATTDIIIISILSVVIFIAEYFSHAAEHLFQFALDYKEWEVDNAIFVVIMMSVGFGIFSYRRVKELSVEMEARRSAERVAEKLARHDPLTGLPNRRFFV